MNNDCLLCVIGFLGLDDVMKCSLVNKQFNVVMRSEMIWIQLFREHFWNVPCTKNFYDNFKECFEFDKFLKECSRVHSTNYDYWTINECITWPKINFYNRNISILPHSVGQLASLKFLVLRSNMLSILPNKLYKLSLLKELNLENNRFDIFPEVIYDMSSLQILDLSHNKLSTLSTKISHLSLLEELYLGYNELQMIPNTINQLTNLRILSIHHNNLEKLPMIDNLVNLKSLRLDQNQMSLVTPEMNTNRKIIGIC
jgi:hypothetical protein